MVYWCPNRAWNQYKRRRNLFYQIAFCKLPIIDFHWKVQKQGFTRIFIFLFEFHPAHCYEYHCMHFQIDLYWKWIVHPQTWRYLKICVSHVWLFSLKKPIPFIIVQKQFCYKSSWVSSDRDSNLLTKEHTIQSKVRIA